MCRGEKNGLSMNLKIVSWNIRGGNDSAKRKIIKAVLRDQRLDIFCLQETKMHVMSDKIVRSLGSSRFLDWVALDAIRTTGGCLWCGTKEALFFWTKKWVCSQSLACSRMSLMALFGLSLVFMVLFLKMVGRSFGRSWGQLEVYGRLLGASGETLMSLASPLS